MPSWGEILTELQQSAQQRGGNPDFDGIRRKYLVKLHNLTGRNAILYSTDWLGGGRPAASIGLEDMQGMMEVCRGLQGPDLDLILHSPGGSAEATASVVRYLRTKFSDIRVFVPLAAMSAATMWALAGNRIVMGKHSQLGPIDPQLLSSRGITPARAIIEQFERAKLECSKDPSLLGAWVPILEQYGPALIEQCEKAEALARRLVREWLEAYMFAGEPKADAKAEQVAAYFADYGEHQSHALGIDRETAKAKGVKVEDLEANQDLQDAVLSVHHATLHTFQGPAVKIVENHLGRTFARVEHQITVEVPVQPAPPGAMPPGLPNLPGPAITSPPGS